MRLLIADDHVLFGQGLASLLAAQPGFSVVGVATSVAEVVAMAHELQPELILMDFTLPDGTGLDATQEILADHPQTMIIFLTVHEDDERLFAAIRSGAKGYLLKNVSVTKLLGTLRSVEHGGVALSDLMIHHLLDEFARTDPPRAPSSDGDCTLTPRELEVLEEVATGATNAQIAARLVISAYTVKNHVSNILAKLNVSSRQEAALYARRQGIL